METNKNAFSPRVETDWMNDPSVPIEDHIDRIANFDYAAIDPIIISRHKAHEANIAQKEVRRNSVHNIRRAIIAQRALANIIEV